MEIWKDIKGYEGLYQVSNLGRVKSLERIIINSIGKKKTVNEIILKPIQISKNITYVRVNLCKNGIKKLYSVHRLVAEAFIPNPNNLPEVNHKDENKQSNFVYINENGTVDLEKSNLEWCTAKYNMNYGTARERMIEKQRGQKRKPFSEEEKKKRRNKPSLSKSVLQINKQTNEVIAEFPSTMEVQRKLGYFTSSIISCCNGKLKQAYGFIWRYKESVA